MADPQVQQDLNWQHPANASVKIEDAERGAMKCVPSRPAVAIVGFASTTRMQAPFDDPSYEIWGLNQLYRHIPRADRWWEIHYRAMFEADIVRDTDYVAWLQRCPIPIIMAERQADIPNSVRWPRADIFERFKAPERMIPRIASAPRNGFRRRRDYFTSTIPYMMALALFEGFERIGIYGIDLIVGSEYFYQKACLEYWIGRAEGMGVEVEIPEDSALLKGSHLYGLEPAPVIGHVHPALMKEREGTLMNRRGELLTELNAVDGAIQENQYWQQIYDMKDKGAVTS